MQITVDSYEVEGNRIKAVMSDGTVITSRYDKVIDQYMVDILEPEKEVVLEDSSPDVRRTTWLSRVDGDTLLNMYLSFLEEGGV